MFSARIGCRHQVISTKEHRSGVCQCASRRTEQTSVLSHLAPVIVPLCVTCELLTVQTQHPGLPCLQQLYVKPTPERCLRAMPRLADMLRPGSSRRPDRHCPLSSESGILQSTETSQWAMETCCTLRSVKVRACHQLCPVTLHGIDCGTASVGTGHRSPASVSAHRSRSL